MGYKFHSGAPKNKFQSWLETTAICWNLTNHLVVVMTNAFRANLPKVIRHIFKENKWLLKDTKNRLKRCSMSQNCKTFFFELEKKVI